MNTDERYSKIYEDEIDLWKYFQALWKRRVVILFATLFCAVFAGVISFILPKSYQSELLIKIGSVGSIGNAGNVGNVFTTHIENEIMIVELINSKSFLTTVINKNLNRWGRLIDPKELKVKATVKKSTSLAQQSWMVKIQAEGRSPQQAVEIVNAIASEVIFRHKEKFDSTVAILKKMEENLNIQIGASEKQIEELKKILMSVRGGQKMDISAVILLRANLSDRENYLTFLKQRVENLKLASSALYTENTKVTDPPVMPEKPVKPKKAINIAMGTVFGLIISIFWAFGVESLDSWRSKQKKI
jgi:capsular polysaccharide biosynthesis protein